MRCRASAGESSGHSILALLTMPHLWDFHIVSACCTWRNWSHIPVQVMPKSMPITTSGAQGYGAIMCCPLDLFPALNKNGKSRSKARLAERTRTKNFQPGDVKVPEETGRASSSLTLARGPQTVCWSPIVMYIRSAQMPRFPRFYVCMRLAGGFSGTVSA